MKPNRIPNKSSWGKAMGRQANPNLEILCAEAGQGLASIGKMNEKILNDALAVLEEHGPYAMFLYIKAQHKEVSGKFQQHCIELLKKVFHDEISGKDTLEIIQKLAENLGNLLFARDLLRNALIYARYHLKAKESSL